MVEGIIRENIKFDCRQFDANFFFCNISDYHMNINYTIEV